jgi:hypothetical protein
LHLFYVHASFSACLCLFPSSPSLLNWSVWRLGKRELLHHGLRAPLRELYGYVSFVCPATFLCDQKKNCRNRHISYTRASELRIRRGAFGPQLDWTTQSYVRIYSHRLWTLTALRRGQWNIVIP